MTKNLLFAAALLSWATALTGCTTYKNQGVDMKAAWRRGQAAMAAAQFGTKAQQKDKSIDSVIWHLEAGTAYRAAGDFTNSNFHLDAAAAGIEQYEEKAKIKVANEAVAMMSNLQSLPYEGKPYDKIMLHTYKALNYLMLDDDEKARPEIIRAYQYQEDAVVENSRRIEKALQSEQNSTNRVRIQESKSDPKFAADVENVTKELEGFKFYSDYVNPFTVYLDGIYFLYAGAGGSDLEHANKSLNRVMEVCGDNKFVLADLQSVTNLMVGQSPTPCTYVIFETGEAASLDQIKISVPIIVSKVSYIGVAFPKLVLHGDNVSELFVKGGGVEEKTTSLATMDSIVALDFKNEFPTIVTKTLMSTVAKAAAAYAINGTSKKNDASSLLLKIITALIQESLNIADTRTWTTLPKEFQVARIATPSDRQLSLSTAAGLHADIELIEGPINFVYVKSISASSPLLVSQFKLGKTATRQVTQNEIK